MSQINARPLDLENQRIIQILIDKLLYLHESKDNTDEISLFAKACEDTDIKFNKYFREDISNIFNLSCQIILNQNICLVYGTGNTKNDSFRNAVEKFINFCFIQRSQTPPTISKNTCSFVDELFENCENIDIIDNFVEKCKDHVSRYSKFDYQSIKKEWKSKNSELVLSESFHFDEKYVICSIYLNENLLLQQGKGENNKKALENTFNEMLEAYSIISNANTRNDVAVVLKNKNLIIQKMAKEYKQNKLNSVNHWVTIEKCAKDLGFHMDVQFKDKLCTVSINDVEILKVCSDNDYCGYIAACKDFIQLFDQTLKVPPRGNAEKFITQDIVTNLSTIKENKIQTIIRKAINIRQNNPSSLAWPIVNNAFMMENMELELHYTSKNLKTMCCVDCQGLQITFAEGDDQPSSREAASLKLLYDTYFFN